MSKHTSGPWTVNGFGGDFEVIARLVPSGVAISAKSETLPKDAIPTACLIASAPELLEALEKIAYATSAGSSFTVVAAVNYAHEVANAAIHKARGES